jgi:pullulanase-type alpha-1,6-glucosidase
VIAVAPGSFQSELGCPGDWDPGCLRSWLQDPDGDGIHTFTTARLPAGSHEVKVAIGESWAENYGAGGVQNGPNIPFTVASDCAATVFRWDASTKVLTVGPAPAPPQPASVTVAGSFQSELGCPGDWQPDCAATQLAFDEDDRVWQATFDVPAGGWEYKAALNGTWAENYGANAARDGANIPLDLSAPAAVKFYYDHGTHWITSSRNAVIAVAPGSFQSELGCPGDWDPGCLRSWLQDPDGDGVHVFTTSALPPGDYEAKVAIGESWDLNYGAGGVQNGPNIAFTVPEACAETTFAWDSITKVLTIGAIGAPKGNLRLARAHWVTGDTIAWGPPAIGPDWTVALHAAADGGLVLGPDGVAGGEVIPLARDPAGLPDAVKEKFPHLASLPAFRIPADRLAEVREILRGQVAVSARDGQGALADATSLQIPGVLDDLYPYQGPLGVAFAAGVPTLRVWAPTARSVSLELFADSDPATAPAVHAMSLDPYTGVWSATGDASWNWKFYRYAVQVWVRTSGGAGEVLTNRVTDPCSVSLSTNSARSQIVDLEDPSLKPPGWDALRKPPLDAPEDVVLYELHVRDFSASDPSVPEALRGTYRAFTLPDTDGMRHLAALARAGLTHVHLLPTFDIATVDEDRSTWLSPGDLSGYPPDSEAQQAAVEAVRTRDGFNWGYDPWHYDVPEGSYATEPDGAARIREYREMVQGLARAGLRVVNDVVYNHTTASGQNEKSVLDRVVPGYYHRLNADGNVERSTCCENTATEHDMMEKLMVDSVVLWARHYRVDGFRFDLMGHHMRRNMEAVRAALDALTPAQDGVDGRKIYVYGEGWNFGEVANGARGVNATQANMAGTGIGSFNDRMRDGARGGGPFSGIQEQGFLTGLFLDPNATDQGDLSAQLELLLLEEDWIQVGLAGSLRDYPLVDRNGDTVPAWQVDYKGQPAGYTADPQEVINYVSAHDNETLFDAIQLKAPVSTSMGDRVRMQNLGMSLVALAQGVPFFHAGVDLLRSKSLDRNSYDSGDWFNRLDFTGQTNNWGVGLPPAQDNQSSWPIHAPLLANPALRPGPEHIARAADHLREVLAIRRSTRLFRLRTAEEVTARVRFHDPGPASVPGLVVMSVADPEGTIDPRHPLVVALFNAGDEAATFALPELRWRKLTLHPVLAGSSDPVVRESHFVRPKARFWIPPRTTAVFWETRHGQSNVRPPPR